MTEERGQPRTDQPVCSACQGKGWCSPDDAERGIQVNSELYHAGYEHGKQMALGEVGARPPEPDERQLQDAVWHGMLCGPNMGFDDAWAAWKEQQKADPAVRVPRPAIDGYGCKSCDDDLPYGHTCKESTANVARPAARLHEGEKVDRNTPATEVIWPQDLPDLIDMARDWPLPTDENGGVFTGDVLIHKLANALKRLAPEVAALHEGKRQREAQVRALEAQLVEIQAMLESQGAKYYELIYAVGKRYPNESRHQTALRYITEAENRDYGPAKSTLTQPGAASPEGTE